MLSNISYTDAPPGTQRKRRYLSGTRFMNDNETPQFHLRRIGPKATKHGVADIMDFEKVATLIGRNRSQVDFYLDSVNLIASQYISRLHARVVKQDDNIHRLYDDSLNGIFVNNSKISGCVILHEGDIVTFGHPNGASLVAGIRKRQPDSEYQFLFEKCTCQPPSKRSKLNVLADQTEEVLQHKDKSSISIRGEHSVSLHCCNDITIVTENEFENPREQDGPDARDSVRQDQVTISDAQSLSPAHNEIDAKVADQSIAVAEDKLLCDLNVGYHDPEKAAFPEQKCSRAETNLMKINQVTEEPNQLKSEHNLAKNKLNQVTAEYNLVVGENNQVAIKHRQIVHGSGENCKVDHFIKVFNSQKNAPPASVLCLPAGNVHEADTSLTSIRNQLHDPLASTTHNLSNNTTCAIVTSTCESACSTTATLTDNHTSHCAVSTIASDANVQLSMVEDKNNIPPTTSCCIYPCNAGSPDLFTDMVSQVTVRQTELQKVPGQVNRDYNMSVTDIRPGEISQYSPSVMAEVVKGICEDFRDESQEAFGLELQCLMEKITRHEEEEAGSSTGLIKQLFVSADKTEPFSTVKQHLGNVSSVSGAASDSGSTICVPAVTYSHSDLLNRKAVCEVSTSVKTALNDGSCQGEGVSSPHEDSGCRKISSEVFAIHETDLACRNVLFTVSSTSQVGSACMKARCEGFTKVEACKQASCENTSSCQGDTAFKQAECEEHFERTERDLACTKVFIEVPSSSQEAAEYEKTGVFTKVRTDSDSKIVSCEIPSSSEDGSAHGKIICPVYTSPQTDSTCFKCCSEDSSSSQDDLPVMKATCETPVSARLNLTCRTAQCQIHASCQKYSSFRNTCQVSSNTLIGSEKRNKNEQLYSKEKNNFSDTKLYKTGVSIKQACGREIPSKKEKSYQHICNSASLQQIKCSTSIQLTVNTHDIEVGSNPKSTVDEDTAADVDPCHNERHFVDSHDHTVQNNCSRNCDSIGPVHESTVEEFAKQSFMTNLSLEMGEHFSKEVTDTSNVINNDFIMGDKDEFRVEENSQINEQLHVHSLNDLPVLSSDNDHGAKETCQNLTLDAITVVVFKNHNTDIQGGGENANSGQIQCGGENAKSGQIQCGGENAKSGQMKRECSQFYENLAENCKTLENSVCAFESAGFNTVDCRSSGFHSVESAGFNTVDCRSSGFHFVDVSDAGHVKDKTCVESLRKVSDCKHISAECEFVSNVVRQDVFSKSGIDQHWEVVNAEVSRQHSSMEAQRYSPSLLVNESEDCDEEIRKLVISNYICLEDNNTVPNFNKQAHENADCVINKCDYKQNTNLHISSNSGCFIVVDNISEQTGDHIVIDNISEKTGGHIVIDNISEQPGDRIGINNISERTGDHIVIDNICEQTGDHIVVDNISEKTGDHIVIDNISEQLGDRSVIDNISEQPGGHIVIDNISKQPDDHIVIDNISEQTGGHIQQSQETNNGVAESIQKNCGDYSGKETLRVTACCHVDKNHQKCAGGCQAGICHSDTQDCHIVWNSQGNTKDLHVESNSNGRTDSIHVDWKNQEDIVDLLADRNSQENTEDLHIESIIQRNTEEFYIDSNSQRNTDNLHVDRKNQEDTVDLFVDRNSQENVEDIHVESTRKGNTDNLHNDRNNQEDIVDLFADRNSQENTEDLHVESSNQRITEDFHVESNSQRNTEDLHVESNRKGNTDNLHIDRDNQNTADLFADRSSQGNTNDLHSDKNSQVNTNDLHFDSQENTDDLHSDSQENTDYLSSDQKSQDNTDNLHFDQNIEENTNDLHSDHCGQENTGDLNSDQNSQENTDDFHSDQNSQENCHSDITSQENTESIFMKKKNQEEEESGYSVDMNSQDSRDNHCVDGDHQEETNDFIVHSSSHHKTDNQHIDKVSEKNTDEDRNSQGDTEDLQVDRNSHRDTENLQIDRNSQGDAEDLHVDSNGLEDTVDNYFDRNSPGDTNDILVDRNSQNIDKNSQESIYADSGSQADTDNLCVDRNSKDVDDISVDTKSENIDDLPVDRNSQNIYNGDRSCEKATNDLHSDQISQEYTNLDRNSQGDIVDGSSQESIYSIFANSNSPENAEKNKQKDADDLHGDRRSQDSTFSICADRNSQEQTDNKCAENSSQEDTDNIYAENNQEDTDNMCAENSSQEDTDNMCAENSQKDTDNMCADNSQKETDNMCAENSSQEDTDNECAENSQKDTDNMCAENSQKDTDNMCAENSQKETDNMCAEKNNQEDTDNMSAEKNNQEDTDNMSAEKNYQEDTDNMCTEKNSQEDTDNMCAEKNNQEDTDNMCAEKNNQEDTDNECSENSQEDTDNMCAEKNSQEDTDNMCAEKNNQEDTDNEGSENSQEDTDNMCAGKNSQEDTDNECSENSQEDTDNMCAEKNNQEDTDNECSENSQEDTDNMCAEKNSQEDTDNMCAEKNNQEDTDNECSENSQEDTDNMCAEKNSQEDTDNECSENSQEDTDNMCAEKNNQEDTDNECSENSQEDTDNMCAEKNNQEDTDNECSENSQEDTDNMCAEKNNQEDTDNMCAEKNSQEVTDNQCSENSQEDTNDLYVEESSQEYPDQYIENTHKDTDNSYSENTHKDTDNSYSENTHKDTDNSYSENTHKDTDNSYSENTHKDTDNSYSENTHKDTDNSYSENSQEDADEIHADRNNQDDDSTHVDRNSQDDDGCTHADRISQKKDVFQMDAQNKESRQNLNKNSHINSNDVGSKLTEKCDGDLSVDTSSQKHGDDQIVNKNGDKHTACHSYQESVLEISNINIVVGVGNTVVTEQHMKRMGLSASNSIEKPADILTSAIDTKTTFVNSPISIDESAAGRIQIRAVNLQSVETYEEPEGQGNVSHAPCANHETRYLDREVEVRVKIIDYDKEARQDKQQIGYSADILNASHHGEVMCSSAGVIFTTCGDVGASISREALESMSGCGGDIGTSLDVIANNATSVSVVGQPARDDCQYVTEQMTSNNHDCQDVSRQITSDNHDCQDETKQMTNNNHDCQDVTEQMTNNNHDCQDVTEQMTSNNHDCQDVTNQMAINNHDYQDVTNQMANSNQDVTNQMANNNHDYQDVTNQMANSNQDVSNQMANNNQDVTNQMANNNHDYQDVTDQMTSCQDVTEQMTNDNLEKAGTESNEASCLIPDPVPQIQQALVKGFADSDTTMTLGITVSAISGDLLCTTVAGCCSDTLPNSRTTVREMLDRSQFLTSTPKDENMPEASQELLVVSPVEAAVGNQVGCESCCESEIQYGNSHDRNKIGSLSQINSKEKSTFDLSETIVVYCPQDSDLHGALLETNSATTMFEETEVLKLPIGSLSVEVAVSSCDDDESLICSIQIPCNDVDGKMVHPNTLCVGIIDCEVENRNRNIQADSDDIHVNRNIQADSDDIHVNRNIQADSDDIHVNRNIQADSDDIHVNRNSQADTDDIFVGRNNRAVIDDIRVDRNNQAVIDDIHVDRNNQAVIDDIRVDRNNQAVIDNICVDRNSQTDAEEIHVDRNNQVDSDDILDRRNIQADTDDILVHRNSQTDTDNIHVDRNNQADSDDIHIGRNNQADSDDILDCRNIHADTDDILVHRNSQTDTDNIHVDRNNRADADDIHADINNKAHVGDIHVDRNNQLDIVEYTESAKKVLENSEPVYEKQNSGKCSQKPANCIKRKVEHDEMDGVKMKQRRVLNNDEMTEKNIRGFDLDNNASSTEGATMVQPEADSQKVHNEGILLPKVHNEGILLPKGHNEGIILPKGHNDVKVDEIQTNKASVEGKILGIVQTEASVGVDDVVVNQGQAEPEELMLEEDAVVGTKTGEGTVQVAVVVIEKKAESDADVSNDEVMCTASINQNLVELSGEQFCNEEQGIHIVVNDLKMEDKTRIKSLSQNTTYDSENKEAQKDMSTIDVNVDKENDQNEKQIVYSVVSSVQTTEYSEIQHGDKMAEKGTVSCVHENSVGVEHDNDDVLNAADVEQKHVQNDNTTSKERLLNACVQNNDQKLNVRGEEQNVGEVDRETDVRLGIRIQADHEEHVIEVLCTGNVNTKHRNQAVQLRNTESRDHCAQGIKENIHLTYAADSETQQSGVLNPEEKRHSDLEIAGSTLASCNIWQEGEQNLAQSAENYDEGSNLSIHLETSNPVAYPGYNSVCVGESKSSVCKIVEYSCNKNFYVNPTVNFNQASNDLNIFASIDLFSQDGQYPYLDENEKVSHTESVDDDDVQENEQIKDSKAYADGRSEYKQSYVTKVGIESSGNFSTEKMSDCNNEGNYKLLMSQMSDFNNEGNNHLLMSQMSDFNNEGNNQLLTSQMSDFNNEGNNQLSDFNNEGNNKIKMSDFNNEGNNQMSDFNSEGNNKIKMSDFNNEGNNQLFTSQMSDCNNEGNNQMSDFNNEGNNKIKMSDFNNEGNNQMSDFNSEGNNKIKMSDCNNEGNNQMSDFNSEGNNQMSDFNNEGNNKIKISDFNNEDNNQMSDFNSEGNNKIKMSDCNNESNNQLLTSQKSDLSNEGNQLVTSQMSVFNNEGNNQLLTSQMSDLSNEGNQLVTSQMSDFNNEGNNQLLTSQKSDFNNEVDKESVTGETSDFQDEEELCLVWSQCDTGTDKTSSFDEDVDEMACYQLGDSQKEDSEAISADGTVSGRFSFNISSETGSTGIEFLSENLDKDVYEDDKKKMEDDFAISNKKSRAGMENKHNAEDFTIMASSFASAVSFSKSLASGAEILHSQINNGDIYDVAAVVGTREKSLQSGRLECVWDEINIQSEDNGDSNSNISSDINISDDLNSSQGFEITTVSDLLTDFDCFDSPVCKKDEQEIHLSEHGCQIKEPNSGQKKEDNWQVARNLSSEAEMRSSYGKCVAVHSATDKIVVLNDDNDIVCCGDNNSDTIPSGSKMRERQNTEVPECVTVCAGEVEDNSGEIKPKFYTKRKFGESLNSPLKKMAKFDDSSVV